MSTLFEVQGPEGDEGGPAASTTMDVESGDVRTSLSKKATATDLYRSYTDCFITLLLPEKQSVSGWLIASNSHALVLRTPTAEFIFEEPGGVIVIPADHVLALFIDHTDAGKEPLPWGPDARR